MNDILTTKNKVCPFCGKKPYISFSLSETDKDGFLDATVQFWCKCGASSNRINFGHLTLDKTLSLNTFDWIWKEKGYDNCGRSKEDCKIRCCITCIKSDDCEFYKENM